MPPTHRYRDSKPYICSKIFADLSKLLVVGTVAFDAIETPFGAATFIGLAASNYSAQPGIVSVVGEDFPSKYMDLLKEKDINIEGLEVVPGGKTFFWSGKYQHDLNKRDTLSTELNVLADFNPEVPPAFRSAKVVMLGNLHPKIQIQVLNQLDSQPRFTVLDTMNYWMDHTWDSLVEVIGMVDVIAINDE